MKKFIIFILILTISLISSLSIACAFTGSYEYNDYVLMTTTGAQVSAGAFHSNNPSVNPIYLWVYNSGTPNDPVVVWSITGGGNSNVPVPDGYEFDWGNFSSQAYISVNGSNYYFIQEEEHGHWYAGPIPTFDYFPVVYIYFPYTNSGTGIPTTPILSINNNQLSWTPSGYTARILYSSTGSGVYDIINSSATSPYTVTNDGFYYVQLNYTHNGSNLVTDTSNRVEYASTNNGGNDSGILNRIFNFFNNVLLNFKNAVSTVSSYISQIGEFLHTLISWLPPDVATVFFAVVIIGLVLGLFLK